MILFSLLLLPTIGQGQESPTPEEYELKRNRYPAEYTSFPLIHFDLKNDPTPVSYLRYVNENGILRPRFESQTVPAGKELAIRGYWISKSLIEAYQAKYLREKGSPSYDQILKSFRSADPKALMEMIARLDEIRRSPENEAEAKQARAVLGTGMIEVEDPAAPEADAEKRRFIPLSLALSGEIALQPEHARVKVLRSVALMLVADSQLQDKQKFEEELQRTFERISCQTSPCATQGMAFGRVLESMLKAGTVDNTTRFNIMDPKYDEKFNRAEQEKLQRILRELRSICLP